ncbi:MAG: amino acid racemase [Pseudomonadota bacterium]
MKLLGLIGGVSPESTAIYYRLLNDAASERLGAEHSANLMLYTLDYGVMIKHYDARDWDAFKAEVVSGATRLKAAGVDALIICSNTTHVAADAVAQATGLPVIHLLDALSAAMKEAKSCKPLLLGTPVVMGEAHYRRELVKRYDGDVCVPTAAEQDVIGRIILDELVRGEVLDTSRKVLKDIVTHHDCDGVILGCTELCMILSQEDFDLPVFDTTGLHAAAASAFAFGEA